MDKEQWQKKGSGHRGRLRDRFLDRGIAGFSDTEILELLLSFGTPRSDCKEPARQLLKRFGSFAAVLETPVAKLQEVKGVGPKNSFALHFVHAAADYYLQQRLKGKCFLNSSSDVKDYLVHTLRGKKQELLIVIFLDSSHGIIESEILSQGSLNVNTVYPREIIRRSLEHHAAALILAHNHPSGSLSPSPQDIHLTRSLYLLCSQMQIQMLDHLIIGDGSYSFADEGMIETLRTECRETLTRFSNK